MESKAAKVSRSYPCGDRGPTQLSADVSSLLPLGFFDEAGLKPDRNPIHLAGNLMIPVDEFDRL